VGTSHATFPTNCIRRSFGISNNVRPAFFELMSWQLLNAQPLLVGVGNNAAAAAA
jgi:hypothetical protein